MKIVITKDLGLHSPRRRPETRRDETRRGKYRKRKEMN